MKRYNKSYIHSISFHGKHKTAMSVTETIRNHLDRLISENKLRPGDKLPKYAEICDRFGITYTTAQRSFKKLEQEGKIRIVNGVGSFLNGGDVLDVEFYLQETLFDFAELKKILSEISEKHQLNLNFILKKRYLKKELDASASTHKVILSEFDPWMKSSGPQMDFSCFPDYGDFMSEFSEAVPERGGTLVPFYCLSAQGAVNLPLLKKTGFENRITELSSMEWWKSFAAACRRERIVPAVKNYFTDTLWSFPLQPLAEIIMANERNSVERLFRTPFFHTKAGKRMFRIMGDLHATRNEQTPFLDGSCALSFNIGSWISIQAGRRGMLPEAFRIIPKMCGKRHLLSWRSVPLQAFANHTVTISEKKRLWLFLKELLSRETQKKLAALSGMISPRKDMRPEDHPWMTREDFRWFFPQEGTVFLTRDLLSKEEIAVLAALYEQHEFFGANPELIRKCMDEKLAVMQNG